MATISAQEFLRGGKPTLVTPATQHLDTLKKQGFFQETANDLKGTWDAMNANFVKGADNIDEIRHAQDQGQQGAITSGLQILGKSAGATSRIVGDSVTGIAKVALPQGAEDKIKGVVTGAAQEVAKNPFVQRGIEAYAQLKQKDPVLARDLEALFGVGSLALDLTGLGAAEGLGKNAATKSGEAVAGTIEAANKLKPAVTDAVVGATDAVANPDKIMQRVARLSKGAQAKFEQTAGESVGSYLNKRGIYGNTEQITKSLFERFTKSKDVADKALEKLQGTFSPTSLKTAMKELMSREARVSTPGALSPDFKVTRQLFNKLKTEGLTMTEINKVKRLFEKNIRLDFVKQNLPEEVARATNIDNALREWQFAQAKKLGLKNLDKINRETRLSKQLMDALGKETAGSMGNNAMTLTDWIMLSGGDPTAIGGFIAKKTLSSKRVRSAIAKQLYKGEKVGLPEAIFEKPKPGLEEFMKK